MDMDVCIFKNMEDNENKGKKLPGYMIDILLIDLNKM